MTSPALNRRTRRGFNKGLGRTRNAPLKIDWKTLIVREWEENGVKHNSHRHYLSITCVNEEAHIHTHDTDEDSGGDGYCGIGVNHDHSCTVNAGEAHNHVFSGYTGVSSASDLLHTHTIGITSQAGSAHTHNLPANWSNGSCTADGCAADPHFHVAGGANANESSHTHGLNGATGNGSGLLRWHTHSVNFACEAGSAHTHIVGTATIAFANCHTLYNHNHGAGVEESSAESTHVHNVIGDTEDAGEPIDGSDTLYAKFEVGQDSADLLGIFEAQATEELLGRADVTHSAELLSNFRVSCPRRMGGNWQRKMWFDGTYYWRGRYDPTADDLIFEYIAAAGLADNVWTINANATIDASGFAADAIIADFTVRGGETGIPTTIHYSDGVDTHVAESDETSLTGWAWQNLTMVFDGTAPDVYKKVNLGANRKAINPILWVTTVFIDVTNGKQWVQTREQSLSGDITGWDAAVDISNVDNTSTIYGDSVRSMGAAGAEADDIMVVYKEGVELKSNYYTGIAWQGEQVIDATTLPGKAAWDFEHGEAIGVEMGHVVYVDADGSVKWSERDAGATEVWSAVPDTLHATSGHLGVGIVEHGAGWLWVVWVEGEDVLEYRLHQCVPEIWFPLLGIPALQFNVTTDAVVTTSTLRQPNTPDQIPLGEAVPICWVGETAPATPCAVGWGILIEYSIGSLKGVLDVRQLTSVDLYARLEVGQNSAELLGRFEAQATADLLGTVDITHSVELLGKFESQATAELLGRFEAQATAELLGKTIIRNIGSADLLGRFEAQATAELFGRFEVGQDSAELLGKFDLGQGLAELLGRFDVGQDSTDLLGRFEAQATADLLGSVNITHSVELLGRFEAQATAELLSKAVIRNIGSADLLGRFEAQATTELLGKTIVRNVGSAELLGKAVVRNIGSAELLGRAEVQQSGSAELLGRAEVQQSGSSELIGRAEIQQSDSAELLGKVEIQQSGSAELLGKTVVRNIGSAELLGKAVIRHVGTPVELLGNGIIRHTDTRELVARCVIRHSATKDLDANVEIVHWEDLYCKTIIRHTATLNLPAIFWTRLPRRLWTNRRYINGVIELDEKLLGDAILEYVIEGVMEDSQGYLDNAGLSYSEWTDITLVPVQILRAVTYGTVAALYARHTQTFRSQVIPSVTPVTVTVIGDAEKAMNYWEDRMNQMLEFYVTSQGGDVMLTSTPDEEPVFSMEDIPEEVTEFVSWRVWLQERDN